MLLYEMRPVSTGLRKFAERSSNLLNFLVLCLIVHQVKGQFNLNPSGKSQREQPPPENAPNGRYFVNQLQNHRITDDQPKPADQLVESHTIRVEESTHSAPSTAFNTNYNTNFDTNPNGLTNPSTYNNPTTTYITNQTPANYQTNGLTNPTLGSTVESTIGTSVATVGSPTSSSPTGGGTTGSGAEHTSEAITKTQMGRLQSSTTPDGTQFASSPAGQYGSPNSRYGPQMAYSPNNMMGSPSLISSIFSKFNGGQMGSYYPYGNHPPNWPNNYGSAYGAAGYPPYGAMGGMGMSGNFIANAFYAKMRPIMSFFQRLTSKFHSPYNNPNYFYGGAYTNGVYNNFGNYGDQMHRSGLFSGFKNPGGLFRNAFQRKSDQTLPQPNAKLEISSSSSSSSSSSNSGGSATRNVAGTLPTASVVTHLQASGSSNQFSSVENGGMLFNNEHVSNLEANSDLELSTNLGANLDVPAANNLRTPVDLRPTTTEKAARAIARVTDANGQRVLGLIQFDESNGMITVNGELSGLKSGGHGIHIHEHASPTNECSDYAIGPHYNPTRLPHGGLNVGIRHLGDLGNIFTDPNELARVDIRTNQSSLTGPNSILNRTIAISENLDDLGQADNERSKLDGNSGRVIACGRIQLVNS